MAEAAQQGAPTEPQNSGSGSTPAPSGGSFSQDDVNRIVSERLAKERSRYEGFDDLKAKAAKFDELEAAKQSTEEKLTGKLTVAEAKAAEAEQKLMRFEIAAAKNLPIKWAVRLSGNTREALEADADELLKELGQSSRTSFDGGTRQPAPAQGGMDGIIRRAATGRR
jgi:Domain of unknown function (DUF4355)